jgi:type II secretory pathway pseudopilin PulG
MKSKGKKIGFTIIELLTVMSIIIILLGILVPSMNAVRRYSKVVLQKGQFHDIGKGLETFSADFDGYPDSSALDFGGQNYCGAMKLCEAMVGQDGLGFHPDSVFDDMGRAIDGTTDLYYNRATSPPTPPYSTTEEANLRARKPLYIEGGYVQIDSIETVLENYGDFEPNCPVLCDVFKRNDLRNATGEKLGMPVLYYKADPSKLTHDPNTGVTNNTNIYNYMDNHELLEIGVPWLPSTPNPHPMYDSAGNGPVFYSNTRNKSIKITDKPYNQNSFILISAGWDGLYGTRDDVYNFEEK